ncbi:hypothetical protein [Crocosphaera chwakensis]|nr:hypothetical protein [Crocosphaera chwakensis]
MKINLANKTLQSSALAGITLLVLSSIPLLADNPTSQPTSNTNTVPCWNTPGNSQTYQQHRQWMAQQGSMMGQDWQGSGGWGHHSQYGRMYDPNNMATVRGEVVSVNTFTPREGMSGGMHLQLKTDNNQTMDVHLGPAWYLQNQDVQIQPNDNIEVIGSRMNFNGQSAMMAASVQKGEMTLMLRNENGFPMWHGWRGNQ